MFIKDIKHCFTSYFVIDYTWQHSWYQPKMYEALSMFALGNIQLIYIMRFKSAGVSKHGCRHEGIETAPKAPFDTYFECWNDIAPKWTKPQIFTVEDPPMRPGFSPPVSFYTKICEIRGFLAQKALNFSPISKGVWYFFNSGWDVFDWRIWAGGQLRWF